MATPSMVMAALDTEEICRKANYSSMPLFSFAIFVRNNGTWENAATKVEFLYADVVCKLTKNVLGPAFEVKAMTGVFRAQTGPGAKSALEQIDAQLFGASVGTSASDTHLEGNAKLTVLGREESFVNYHLGVGVSTGLGIKDDSLSLKVAGCGFQFGRKIGVSIFDNELAADIGKAGKEENGCAIM